MELHWSGLQYTYTARDCLDVSCRSFVTWTLAEMRGIYGDHCSGAQGGSGWFSQPGAGYNWYKAALRINCSTSAWYLCFWLSPSLGWICCVSVGSDGGVLTWPECSAFILWKVKLCESSWFCSPSTSPWWVPFLSLVVGAAHNVQVGFISTHCQCAVELLTQKHFPVDLHLLRSSLQLLFMFTHVWNS